VKLKRLDADNQRRREVAQYYNDTIQNESIILPKPADDSTNIAGSTIISDLSHIWHIYAIRHPRRDALQQYLAEQDIQTSIHYPIPPHQQQAYKGFNQLSFPVTEQMSRELLSLPMSQVMTQAETEIVVKTINAFEQK
jgi:dTDP-4-amino-4,6-dideoxygalactose transaminase